MTWLGGPPTSPRRRRVRSQVTPDQVALAQQLYDARDKTVQQIADLFEACGPDLWQICDQNELSVLKDRPEVLSHLPEDVLVAYALGDIQ